ncbi:hypothetical protein R6Q59_030343 [Mikania micrantha]
MFGFRKKEPETFDKKDTPERKMTSDPVISVTDSKNDDDDDDDDYFGKTKASMLRKKPKSKTELDSMSTQELEGYAVDQAEETTKSVNNCLKIAEDIREDANKTLDTLHAQGEQIHRTHQKAADMEKDLSKGEKILGNLGGMFSTTWKPKKGKKIKGPEARDEGKPGKKASKEEREKLGLDHSHKGKKASKAASSEPKDAMQKVDLEKEKQDDALDDLSSVLGDLKGMASEMGSELDNQNKALDNLSEDVDELNTRVKVSSSPTFRHNHLRHRRKSDHDHQSLTVTPKTPKHKMKKSPSSIQSLLHALIISFFIITTAGEITTITCHHRSHRRHQLHDHKSCITISTVKYPSPLCNSDCHPPLPQHHRRRKLPAPSTHDDQEFDPRYGVSKRLVPSGPNPLHN